MGRTFGAIAAVVAAIAVAVLVVFMSISLYNPAANNPIRWTWNRIINPVDPAIALENLRRELTASSTQVISEIRAAESQARTDAENYRRLWNEEVVKRQAAEARIKELEVAAAKKTTSTTKRRNYIRIDNSSGKGRKPSRN